MKTCEAVVARYLAELRRDLRCVEIGKDRMLINTPYLLQDGDAIQVVIEALPGGLVRFGDEGAAASRLELAGVDPTKGKTLNELQACLRAYRVARAGDELRVEGSESESAEMFMRLVGALRAVDGLAVLRTEPPAVRFDRRVITFLQSQFEGVTERPRRTGRSGARYTLTAAVPREPEPVLVQAAAGGHGQQGRRSVEHAFRVFSDINGQVPKHRKLVLLSGEDNWPQSELALLSDVAFVGGWNERDEVVAFLRGERIPKHGLLLPFQAPMGQPGILEGGAEG